MNAVNTEQKPIEIDRIVIRFAGDSGDGMQLTGSQFTNTSALVGNSLATLPDYPAEIRAPQGTVAGVSGFQIQFGEIQVHTPGDEPDVLVAMNPAALKANLSALRPGGTIIINEDAFTETNYQKAGYGSDPLQDGSLSNYKLVPIPITRLTRNALEGVDLDGRSKDRCKNFFALGLMYWMYSRPLDQTKFWIEEKFKNKPVLVEANLKALNAGFTCGIAIEALPSYVVKAAPIHPGTYRNISGNEAIALGLIAASERSERPLFIGSYPITPASDILHDLSKYKEFGVVTFQAEDEIAAVCASIGAAYAGSLALTSTSGPGLDLKAEAIGLAIKTELPLLIINVQRAGPSTGMPTKTEQSDLLQAFYGRHGESPLCVLAPATASDCFEIAFEAARIALKYMIPVILLTDGYLANGAEPWLLPDLNQLPKIESKLLNPDDWQDKAFYPYTRDEDLARPWAVPGVAGFEHRLSGLETQLEAGTISYDPSNHQKMTDLRAAKIKQIQKDIPPLKVSGPSSGDILLLGWGGTYGSIRAATEELQKLGKSVAQAHLRHLNPFPSNLEEVLRSYKHVIVPELNCGQLVKLIRAEFLIDAHSLSKVEGQPFKVREILDFVSKF
ncbi:MAG: 2-oxoacid:acceptor oxidoreductase subunit alpha [Candidatus Caenarcaniphilales bacterium]|nr:2-oxoacid:acceptor oxidoreductase subunit alpha [Candidatus Caenarcaniphilales bacterium]